MMIKIITPTIQDLPRLAQCHRSAFPKSLSTAMGQEYVEKMLEWYLKDDRAFIFMFEEDGQCVGYCGGLKFDGTARVGSASSMIQHSYDQAVKTFLRKPWLFFHPEMFPKYRLAAKNVLRRIKKSFGVNDKPQPMKKSEQEAHTGLVVIGVDEKFQSKGYGSMMLKEFEQLSEKMGFKKMMLTVRTNNQQAIRSYARNGWVTTVVAGNSTTMEKRLN